MCASNRSECSLSNFDSNSSQRRNRQLDQIIRFSPYHSRFLCLLHLSSQCFTLRRSYALVFFDITVRAPEPLVPVFEEGKARFKQLTADADMNGIPSEPFEARSSPRMALPERRAAGSARDLYLQALWLILLGRTEDMRPPKGQCGRPIRNPPLSIVVAGQP